MLKSFHIWLPGYLFRRRLSQPAGVVDVMICVCDHFEPLQNTGNNGALTRLAIWKREFSRITESFRDADDCPPRHTFFYPVEQYNPDVVAELASVCRLTGSEAEIHLHHDDDTSEHLRGTLEQAKKDLAGHGLLSRDASGALRYGFVHGNWALDNSHPEGKYCGVANELDILAETGCYADFTMPSAPDSTQTSMINSLYYATDTPAPKSHNTGERVRVNGPGAGRQKNRLLMVQGPLGLNWARRKFRFLPRIENADLTEANPPTEERFRVWTRLGARVEGRPEWLFIKLHTHGGKPANLRMLLEEPMWQFHQFLKSNFGQGDRCRYHYVTAREMVNIIHAAEDGYAGNPGKYRDYCYQLASRQA